MNRRHLVKRLLQALADTPAVFLRGARQTGKTTLAQNLGVDRFYVSLDSATALAAALEDPTGFLRGLPKPATIDEAQRAPGLFLAIKEDIDRVRQPGRFLLTGSANILAKAADSLAGRLEVLTLYPLSQGEIAGVQDDFITKLFSAEFSPCLGRSAPNPESPAAIGGDGAERTWPRERLWRAMTIGGYPEVGSRARAERREAWFDSYLTALVERDVRDIANIQDRGGLIRLIRLLAARSGGLHNAAELSRSSGLAIATLHRYLAVLEALFLIWLLPPWSANLGKRLVKSPKLHVTDSGLAAFLCGADEARLASEPILAGRLLESFVASELRRQAGWSERRVELYHYRSHSGDEIDLVLEDRAGRVAAVEVKYGETPTSREARGLINLRDAAGEKFVRGVVLHTGRESFPLTDKIFTCPLNVLFGE